MCGLLQSFFLSFFNATLLGPVFAKFYELFRVNKISFLYDEPSTGQARTTEDGRQLELEEEVDKTENQITGVVLQMSPFTNFDTLFRFGSGPLIGFRNNSVSSCVVRD